MSASGPSSLDVSSTVIVQAFAFQVHVTPAVGGRSGFDGVGVGVAEGVGVAVGVDVGVRVGRGVGVSFGVAVGGATVSVGVAGGVSDGTGVGVSLGVLVGVCVTVGEFVGVFVGVPVGVGVEVGVAVFTGVWVGVLVGVFVGETVGVVVGVLLGVMVVVGVGVFVGVSSAVLVGVPVGVLAANVVVTLVLLFMVTVHVPAVAAQSAPALAGTETVHPVREFPETAVAVRITTVPLLKPFLQLLPPLDVQPLMPAGLEDTEPDPFTVTVRFLFCASTPPGAAISKKAQVMTPRRVRQRLVPGKICIEPAVRFLADLISHMRPEITEKCHEGA